MSIGPGRRLDGDDRDHESRRSAPGPGGAVAAADGLPDGLAAELLTAVRDAFTLGSRQRR